MDALFNATSVLTTRVLRSFARSGYPVHGKETQIAHQRLMMNPSQGTGEIEQLAPGRDKEYAP